MDQNDICSKCISVNGGCCVSVRFTIHGDEVAPFVGRYKSSSIPKGHIFKKMKDRNDQYLYSSKNDPCMFLGKDNKCSIYLERPVMCRMYPLLWKRDLKKNNSLFIDVSCPLIYLKPIKEIILWSKDHKNMNQMKKMGSLDFDGRNRNYINFTQLKKDDGALSLVED
ncbi:MAG: hypothetical protein HeimC3_45260 [Candidatus Heimdallarchaeota archaeon LC_3]|nr:MAG: hypothetical protein HeimC3_45260 [Candidatus Heimdallarchaeota archaeon LC_3]